VAWRPHPAANQRLVGGGEARQNTTDGNFFFTMNSDPNFQISQSHQTKILNDPNTQTIALISIVGIYHNPNYLKIIRVEIKENA
jgi:hypothetical protein